jgi:hypothetical protein
MSNRLNTYFRKTIGYPNGAIVHDGDCHIFSYGVCTCGLLHLLNSSLVFQNDEELYKKFEKDIVKHENNLYKLRDDEYTNELDYPREDEKLLIDELFKDFGSQNHEEKS